MTFLEGLLFALLAIIIVMAALALLILAITPLRRLSHEQKPSSDKPQTTIDLKGDEDKTIAALIASIDYKQQTVKDIRLVSIKEINQ